jgi:O-antigen/teichoic acid export membrane protein
VEGLANTPAKLARMLSLNLSIILLATVGISTSEVGTFYIAITISITVSSLITSMGFMIIPTSAESKRNLSFMSLKFGVSLTAPLIAGLIAAPQFILSLIGPQYIAETTSLVVLSIAILPYSILTTSISSFNLTGNFRKIILVGCVQVVTFLLTFYILAPSFGTVGTSIAILMAFISSSSICLVWMKHAALRIIWNSCIALAIGWLISYLINISFDFNNVYAQLLSITGAVIGTFIVLVMLKSLSLKELNLLKKGLLNTSSR